MTILTCPQTWTEVPAWTLCTSREEFGVLALPLLSMSAARGLRLRELAEGRAPSADMAGYRVVRHGDLVVNKLSARDGALAVADRDGLVSPAYWVLTLTSSVHPPFLHHLLRSAPYRAEISRRSKHMPPAQFDLSWDQFRTLPIVLPPLQKQQRIAEFLDQEVALLDRTTSEHNKLLSLLDERIDARIGTHISAALASTSAQQMSPIKRLLQKLDRPAEADAQVVTAFRDGQVIARVLRRMDGFTESWTDGSVVQGVVTGDVVVHGLDGFAGAVGTAESTGVCSPANHVCRLIADGDTDFYGRLLRVFAVCGYLSLYGGSARERAVDFRNWETFARTPIPTVSTREQAEIGDMIRATRPLKASVNRLLALLEERKQAVIAAAVTGDCDVTTAKSVA